MKTHEIERKFLVEELPDLSKLVGTPHERHFLYINPPIELRIQKKGSRFEIERKITESELSRQGFLSEITEPEFELLKKLAIKSLVRVGYELSSTPRISIKVYKEQYEGLVRAEVEFGSIEEANAFVPASWMRTEITDSPLGKDAKLVNLTREELLDELKKYE